MLLKINYSILKLKTRKAFIHAKMVPVGQQAKLLFDAKIVKATKHEFALQGAIFRVKFSPSSFRKDSLSVI